MTATFFITYICVVSAISVIVGIFICLVYFGPELKRQMEIDISVKKMEKAVDLANSAKKGWLWTSW